MSAAAAALVNDKLQLFRTLGTTGRIHFGAKLLPWSAWDQLQGGNGVRASSPGSAVGCHETWEEGEGGA